MLNKSTIAMTLAGCLILGCGGESLNNVQPTQPIQLHAVQGFASQLQIGDIEKGTFCYAEVNNPNANVADLKAAFNGSNWLQTILNVYERRWPSGKALAQAQANDQYFKQFVDTTSFNKLAESLMVAIHEETHMWDLAAGRTEWNNYTSAWVDNTFQFNKIALHDGFPRKEILALIKDDASSETDNVYLKDAQQGEYHLQGVTAELNASLMGLPAALMVADFIDGIGASNSRDLALTNMNYLQLYLRIAKANHPQFWNQIKAEPELRKFVLVQFLRMSYFIELSKPAASKLGSSKVPALLARVYAPENIAIMEEFTGYKFPRDVANHCMGSTTPQAPSITSQPVASSVALGQSVNFAVGVTGSGPITYQWRKNGSNLPTNANAASFNIAAASLQDAGSYSVLVSNSLGSVVSREAVLTVDTAPPRRELIVNGGFESGVNPWQGSTGAIGNFSSQGYPAFEGSRAAWLGGNGSSATETLFQTISIPANASSAQLSFQLGISTSETTSSVTDKLAVQVLNSSGTVLGTLANYSNRDARSGYQARSMSLLPYRGQNVRVYFKMTENASKQTSFMLDKVSVSVQ